MANSYQRSVFRRLQAIQTFRHRRIDDFGRMTDCGVDIGRGFGGGPFENSDFMLLTSPLADRNLLVVSLLDRRTRKTCAD